MADQRWLTSISSLWISACVVAVGGPVALWIPSLEPPWPEGGAAIVAVVFSVVALIIGHSGASWTKEFGTRRQRLWRLWTGCGSLMLSVLLCVLYLYAYSLHVATEVKLEGGREISVRRVVGSMAIDIRNAQRADRDLLKEYSFEEDRIWTRQSLTGARLTVLLPYAGMFFFLALGLSSLPMSRDAAPISKPSHEEA